MLDSTNRITLRSNLKSLFWRANVNILSYCTQVAVGWSAVCVFFIFPDHTHILFAMDVMT